MVDGDGWDTELKKLVDLWRDPGKCNVRFELSSVHDPFVTASMA
jgi:hypothetical protein